MTQVPDPSTAQRWAHFRFAVVGPLLSAPPPHGQLKQAIAALAAKQWTHPVRGGQVQFSAATIERWYYLARRERHDPVGVLRRAVRVDCGKIQLSEALAERLLAQFEQHPDWSYRLHYDNLVVAVKAEPKLGRLPSYSTIRRYMQARGLVRRSQKLEGRPGQRREVRSYEADYAGSLWHLDFHHGSLKLLSAGGQWQRPIALGILDDHSRLCCHLQWYLSETAEDLVHGLSQAIQKRGLPRSLMTDNGPAMVAEEFSQGLLRLGIVHYKTLPYSPYQNGKQEAFWGTLEGRLMKMLTGVKDLTLDFLNQASQAWTEIEYNRTRQRELAASPVDRFARAPDVLRESPASAVLREAFRLQTSRRQRRSDGTISLAGQRFEIPARYRHFQSVTIRYARWDLGRIDLVDPLSDKVLAPIYPLDRTANADGRRAPLAPDLPEPPDDGEPPASGDLPPLLRKILQDYSATGLPPAYLPKVQHDEPGDA